MSMRLMLDTNTISYIVSNRQPKARMKMLATDPRELCISAITQAETIFGVAKKSPSKSIISAIDKMFAEIAVLPFNSSAAATYGELRATMERQGKSLQSLDMLIAAHALDAGLTLVTSDRAFRFMPGLSIEDWTTE